MNSLQNKQQHDNNTHGKSIEAITQEIEERLEEIHNQRYYLLKHQIEVLTNEKEELMKELCQLKLENSRLKGNHHI
ncbi:hypothetical protein ABK040_001096 [Willaertia magna]